MITLIDREDHQKLYMQLYEIIKKKIENNEWTVGSQIPTEEDLCKLFNVSRSTVRTAILELVRQGYLKRQQGKGTFICKSIVSEGIIMTTALKEIMAEEYQNLSSKVLVRTVMMPVEGLEEELDLPEDKHVIYIKRIWTFGNEPVFLQEIYIPYHICPHLLEDDIESNSLFELFEKKYGIKITRVANSVDIANLNSEEARQLALPEGSAALLLTQQFYSGETLFMYSRSLERQDKFKFFIELERKAV